MTKQQAEQIYVLVNSQQWQSLLQYKRDRIEALHLELEWQNPANLPFIQGKISELRQDLALHQKVTDFLDQK